jgi:hypothetical protein
MKRYEHVIQSEIEANIKKYLNQGKIYIPYCVVSSKNSKKMVTLRNGRKMLISSDQFRLYEELSLPYYNRMRGYFKRLVSDLPKPYILGFHHIRFSKERWDHHNMMQGPADLMIKASWIDDDDMENIEIHPDGYQVDKEHQGLIITPYSKVRFEEI